MYLNIFFDKQRIADRKSEGFCANMRLGFSRRTTINVRIDRNKYLAGLKVKSIANTYSFTSKDFANSMDRLCLSQVIQIEFLLSNMTNYKSL